MVVLASTDVTVTISNRNKDIGHGRIGKNLTIASLAFGNAVLTYPTNGVPLPAIANFGFQRMVDFGLPSEPGGSGFTFKYDKTNHKIKIYTQGVRTGSTVAASPGTGALIENSAAAETAARLAGSAIDTTYDLGALIELPATIAVPAITLDMLMLGE